MNFLIYLILRIHAPLLNSILKRPKLYPFNFPTFFDCYSLWYLNLLDWGLFLNILASNIFATIFSFEQKLILQYLLDRTQENREHKNVCSHLVEDINIMTIVTWLRMVCTQPGLVGDRGKDCEHWLVSTIFCKRHIFV